MKRTVIALVDDLFWRTKIDHAVQSAGATTTFLSNPAELASVDPDRTPLVVVDLSLRTPRSTPSPRSRSRRRPERSRSSATTSTSARTSRRRPSRPGATCPVALELLGSGWRSR